MRRGLVFFLCVILFPLVSQTNEGDWENFYRDGELAEELLTDDLQRPLQSRFYKDGRLNEVRSYVYEENLVTIDVRKYERDGSQKSWREVLHLREDGSIRLMEKTEGDRSVLTGLSARTEWTRGDDSQEIRLLGREGEIRERVVFRGDEKREEEFFSYGDEGVPVSSELIRSPEGERVVTRYTSSGLPSEILSYKKGLLTEESKRYYDEASRLIREESRGKGVSTERTFEYGPDSEIAEERIYKNGFMTRKILYDGEERTEEIYSKGRLTLTIRYRGTEILREEKAP